MSQRLKTDRIKKIKSAYNLIPTISWSLLGFTPIGYFCYAYMELLWLYTFLTLGVATLFLPNSFFMLIRLSSNTSTYQKIGIRITKKLTQDGDLVNRSVQRRFPKHKSFQTNSAMKKLITRSYFHEKTHFAMLVFFLLASVYAIFHNLIFWACAITLTNLVFNLYPIFLQKYNRLRIEHAIKRQLRS